MTAKTITASTDRNLLFGILALQMDFISRDNLISGMQAWVLAKDQSLAEHLEQLGALAHAHRRLLEPLVEAHIHQHGDDPQQSLAQMPSASSVIEVLQHVKDEQLQASLECISRRHPKILNADPFTTVTGVPLTPAASPKTRYQIVRLHAEGGLGKVYVARDDELGREVAVKEIKPGRADDQARARFLREAEITGGLEHPGIVPVYSLGTYPDGRPYYAMRFVRGESLKDALGAFHRSSPSADCSWDKKSRNADARKLELRRLLQRLIAVCGAIDYAHSRGVLHRDLKPANIMLGRYGETLVVDWGLSKAIGRPAIVNAAAVAQESPLGPAGWNESALIPELDGGSEPTLDGSALGTPGFLSPEQAQGRLDLVGPASDVFSLGATLYAILTGQPPYQGEDPMGQARAARFPAPSALRPDVPHVLEAICLKAMAARPSDRYLSAGALAQDLEKHLADQPVTAYRETPSERLGRWARHNRSWVRAGGWAMVAISIISVVAAAFIYHAWTDARIQRLDAVEAQRRAEKLALREMEIAALERDQRERAERLASEKLALAEEKGALADFLLGTFQAADPIGMGGADFFIPKQDSENLTALQILDRGAERIRDDPQFVNNRLAQAAVMDAIGNAYRQLGSFDQARPLLEDALRIRRERLPQNHTDVADSCFHMGWCLHEMGDFPRARPLYEESLAIHKSLGSADSTRQLAVIQRNLAWMLAYEGQSDEAERLFRETIAYQETANISRKDLAIAKFGLAFCLVDGGKFLEALPVVMDAQQEWAHAQQNPHFNQASTEFCLGIMARHRPEVPGQALLLGRNYNLRQSETHLRKALETFSRAAGPEHYVTGVMRFELARTLNQLGKLDDAEQEFRRALKIARDKVHMEHPRLVIALDAFASFLKSRGKTEEAVALWSEFLAGQRRRFGADHQYVARALLAEARFLLSISDYDRATDRLRDCINICNRNTLVERELLSLATADLGFCFLRLERFEDAERNLIQALSSLEQQSSRSHDLPFERIQILTDLAQTWFSQGKRDVAAGQFAEAHAAVAAYAGRQARKVRARDYVLENEAKFWRAYPDPQRAAEASLQRRSLWPEDARELYAIAGELSECAGLYAPPFNTDQEQHRALCIREALATLRSAISAGYKSRSAIEASQRFQVLRERLGEASTLLVSDPCHPWFLLSISTGSGKSS